jgi:hypothetical protein
LENYNGVIEPSEIKINRCFEVPHQRCAGGNTHLINDAQEEALTTHLINDAQEEALTYYMLAVHTNDDSGQLASHTRGFSKTGVATYAQGSKSGYRPRGSKDVGWWKQASHSTIIGS